jgi:hypothetical protein
MTRVADEVAEAQARHEAEHGGVHAIANDHVVAVAGGNRRGQGRHKGRYGLPLQRAELVEA